MRSKCGSIIWSSSRCSLMLGDPALPHDHSTHPGQPCLSAWVRPRGYRSRPSPASTGRGNVGPVHEIAHGIFVVGLCAATRTVPDADGPGECGRQVAREVEHRTPVNGLERDVVGDPSSRSAGFVAANQGRMTRAGNERFLPRPAGAEAMGRPRGMRTGAGPWTLRWSGHFRHGG